MIEFGVVLPEGGYSLRGAVTSKGSMMHSILRELLCVGMVEDPRLLIHHKCGQVTGEC